MRNRSIHRSQFNQDFHGPVCRDQPQENYVFDITLLLEKIVADFAPFKSNVRSMVRDILKMDNGLFGILTQMLSQRVGSAALLAINALPLLILPALGFTPEHLINNPYLVLVYFAGFFLGKIKATILGPIEVVDIEKLQSLRDDLWNSQFESLYTDKAKAASRIGMGELQFLFMQTERGKGELENIDTEMRRVEETNSRRKKVNFNSMIFLVSMMLYHLVNFVSYTSYRFK